MKRIVLFISTIILCHALYAESNCDSYAKMQFEQHKNDNGYYFRGLKMEHGPDDQLELEHIANLIDSDYYMVLAREAEINPIENDISKLLPIAPLGDLPLDRFLVVKTDDSAPIGFASVFSLPDRGFEQVIEGAYSLERFSRKIDAKVRPFNLITLHGSLPEDTKDQEEYSSQFLRYMRSGVYLSDEQLAKYGVQFAISTKNHCHTLSYAKDVNGIVGQVYTSGVGNYLNEERNSTRVSGYGQSAQGKIWYKLRGRSQGEMTFYILPVHDNIGLISVLEQETALVFRANDYALVREKFAQSGPNNLTFGEVARECTKIALKKYAEYEQRSDGRFPLLHGFVMQCMQNSNFKRLGSNAINSMRVRLVIDNRLSGTREYYVRKFQDFAHGTFVRFNSVNLIDDTDNCLLTKPSDNEKAIECLKEKGYQVTDLKDIKPRANFRKATEEENKQIDESIRQGTIRAERGVINSQVSKRIDKDALRARVLDNGSVFIERIK